jgi:hypothetical protein
VVAAHSHSSVLYMHRDLPVYVSQLYTSPQFHTYNMSHEKKWKDLMSSMWFSTIVVKRRHNNMQGIRNNWSTAFPVRVP